MQLIRRNKDSRFNALTKIQGGFSVAAIKHVAKQLYRPPKDQLCNYLFRLSRISLSKTISSGIGEADGASIIRTLLTIFTI